MKISKRQLFSVISLSLLILFFVFMTQMRLFLGLILYLSVVLFYRGVEISEVREIEFEYKEYKE